MPDKTLAEYKLDDLMKWLEIMVKDANEKYESESIIELKYHWFGRIATLNQTIEFFNEWKG